MYRNVILTAFLVLVGIVLISALSSTGGIFGKPPISLSPGELASYAEKQQLKSAQWQDREIKGELKDGTRYTTYCFSTDTDAGSKLLDSLQKQSGLKVEIVPPSVGQGMLVLFAPFATTILIIALFYFFFIRPAQAGGNQAMSFGRSRAKRVGESGQKITFDDVAGVEEAKQELFEIVDFLKNTKKYVALGAKIPKGVLLTGPPGVGKTHLARAIAGEAGVPFFHISGSDFVEMFVGVGAARVRDLFETAKAHRPCLIFVDEIDAVGRQRGAGVGGGHDEREQTLNQLLVEMDGFDANTGVIIVAATNRPDVLDPALLRPGRFDRQLVVDAPDARGREAILKIHAKGKPLSTDVDLSRTARRTSGFTGADLANVLNESALLAARRNKVKIEQADVNEAIDRVIAGPERHSRVIDPKERELIAYHEAGHAIVGELLSGCDPVHKVTILPRGMSLGSTWHLPETDKYLENREDLLDDICSLLAGREAETLVFGSLWTGSTSDLERVTRIARAMVCSYGMSEKVGTRTLGRVSSSPFLGRDYYEEKNYSEDIAKLIDEEVHHIVENCQAKTRQMLSDNRDKLDTVVQALLERETLDREEFLAVLNGETLPPIELGKPENSETPKSTEKSTGPIPPPRFEPDPA